MGIIVCSRVVVGRISQAIFQRKSLNRSVSCNFQIFFHREDGDMREVPIKSLFRIARYAEVVVNHPKQEGVNR